MTVNRKPKWIPPRENTGSAAASRRSQEFWAKGGIVITTDPRMMKTPHQTRRRKYQSEQKEGER